jgi:NAD(P)H-dependent flavin oxidoreductase YrpB (nitropropane dioxygenase family)
VRHAVRIPIIAAGGIMDGRAIAAAMMLDADAVQIGTAFPACEESGANPLHRTALSSLCSRVRLPVFQVIQRLIPPRTGLRAPFVRQL